MNDIVEELDDSYKLALRASKTIRELRIALIRIEKWELPPTGRFFENGTPMSYAYCYGSNGERDYFRAIARQALNKDEEL